MLHFVIMRLNVTDAAKAVGKSRATLYRHHKLGKLSWDKSSTDQPMIDVSELQRVYGLINLNNTNETISNEQLATRDDTNSELEILKLRLQHANELLAIEKERREQAEILLRQLTPAKNQEINRQKLNWFQRLFSR